MSLEKLMENIKLSSHPKSRELGYKLYKGNNIKNLKSKKINKIYHIYSEVKENNICNKVHIAFHMVNKEFTFISCTCNDMKENKNYHEKYMCKHALGVFYLFYQLSTKGNKINKQIKRKKLELYASVVCNEVNNKVYEIQFKVKDNTIHNIYELESFIKKYFSKEKFKINNDFLYDPNIHCFDESDKKLLKFIYKNIKDIVGRNLKISEGKIKDFFECINKKITFKYDYIEYKTEVLKRDLELGFTLKYINNKIILTTKKKEPVNLDCYNSVFFYDRHIYLPSEEQIKYYSFIYDKLKNNKSISYEYTLENLSKIMHILTKITDKIIIDESIKEMCNKLSIPKYEFYGEGNNIYCKIKVNYNGEIIDILNSKSNNILRDYLKEEKIKIKLENYSFKREKDNYIFIGNEEDFLHFKEIGLRELSKYGKIHYEETLDKIKPHNFEDIEFHLFQYENKYIFKTNNEKLSLHDYKVLINSYNEGRDFLNLNKNNYIKLKSKFAKEIINIIKNIIENYSEEDEGFLLNKQEALLLSEYIGNNNIDSINVDIKVKELKSRLLNNDPKSFIHPRGLKTKLRDYQKIGVQWLNALFDLELGGILADDMGLGKTVQTIAFLLSKKRCKSIIVVPTALIYNWQYEINKLAPALKVAIVYGDIINRKNLIDKYKEYNIILTTYGTLKSDIDYYKDIIFDNIIIDEGQNIKNPTSQISKIVKKLKGKCKIVLTGTPMENNLIELWAIFDFIYPGLLKSKEKFKKEFLINDKEKILELKRIIKPFILRRNKGDVLKELPEKFERKFFIQMNSSQQNLYNSFLKDVKGEIVECTDKITILSYLTKLRQLCLDPKIVFKDYQGESSKVITCINLIQDFIEKDNKILVFSQFTRVLKTLSEKLKNNNIDFLYLDGDTSANNRVKLVEKFNSHKEVKVFLISLKAGGVGLNLTSANKVIHFDPWWNPAVENQATDRVYRIGQKRVVEVIKLIAKDSIEENILSLQEEKKELINEIIEDYTIDNSKANLNTITKEDIIGILEK